MVDGLGADWTIPEPPQLDPAYVMAEVKRFPEPVFSQLMKQTFEDATTAIDWKELLGEERLAKHEARRKEFGSRWTLRTGIWHAGRLVAWTFGWNDAPGRYYQANSGVLPAHRRKGLYRALMIRVLQRCQEQGFEEVWSKHIATNNPILVAKLRAGFLLTGTELSPSFGSLVTMSCPLIPERREALLVRTGLKKPGPELSRYLS